VLVGQRAQALGGDREPVGEHRKLAATRRDDLAFDADVVAQIHVALPLFQHRGPGPVQGDHDLDLAGAVADRGEAELATRARQQHPAHDPDPVAGGLARAQIRVPLAYLGDRGGPREAGRVGIIARGQHALALAQPHPHLLGQVRFFRHQAEGTGRTWSRARGFAGAGVTRAGRSGRSR